MVLRSAELSDVQRIGPTDPRLSRSLECGVTVLQCFSGSRQVLGIADLANMTGMTRSTTHRYVITLVILGYLEATSKRKYRLSSAASDPGMAKLGTIRRDLSRDLSVEVALEDLRNELGYTVSMGVLDRTLVLYVYRLFGHRPGQHVIDQDLGVGANVPLYCTALGKVLLASLTAAERRELLASLHLVPYGSKSITTKGKLVAELDRVSAQEVIISDEEFICGARSIAVLVPGSGCEGPLAIEVTVTSESYTVDQLVKSVLGLSWVRHAG
jgi:IclR family pca regulon transcriptional regulator